MSKVFFSNWQWAVTDYGMEAVSSDRTPPYEIDAGRLDETSDRTAGTVYGWPVHMAEKNWVDVAAFNEAFEKALVIHKSEYDSEIDPIMLTASLAEAHRVAREDGR